MGDQFSPPPPPPPADDAHFAPPPTDYEHPSYAPGYQQPAQPPTPSSGSKRTLLIVIVAVILVCCCGMVGTGLWAYQRWGFGGMSSSGSTGGMTATNEGNVGSPGQVAAWLSWSGAVDIDLEIYDASGTTYLGSAYTWSGNDITDGSQGDEFMEFTTYANQDFSTGEYMLVAYYFSADDTAYPRTTVELTVQDVNGGVRTYSRSIEYDPSSDQWFAVRIDAATGSVTSIDRVE